MNNIALQFTGSVVLFSSLSNILSMFAGYVLYYVDARKQWILLDKTDKERLLDVTRFL